MVLTKKTLLTRDNANSPMIAESTEMLQKMRFSDDYISQFSDEALGILNDYADLLEEDIEVEYRIAKQLFKVELKVFLPGEQFDPFTSGKDASQRFFNNLPSMNLNTETRKA